VNTVTVSLKYYYRTNDRNVSAKK